MPGRFLVTAVLVLDPAVQGTLDPRGPTAARGALDEPQTSQFLTNLRRLEKRNPDSVAIAANAYVVKA
jgi:hypothetical protein